MNIRPAVINAPNKSYLLNPGPQAVALKVLFAYRKVDFAAMPEMYTGLKGALNKGRNSEVVMTKPNNVMGNYYIGTGIWVNAKKWRVLNEYNLNLDWAARGERGLNFPVVMLKDRNSKKRLVFIAAHLPTLGSSSSGIRQRMNREIKEYADQFDVPVIIAGDFNDGDVRNEYKGYKWAAGYHVDHIFAKGLQVHNGIVQRKGIKGRITDHDAMAIANLGWKGNTFVKARTLTGLIRGARRRLRAR